jgi:hypothetical protein
VILHSLIEECIPMCTYREPGRHQTQRIDTSRPGA